MADDHESLWAKLVLALVTVLAGAVAGWMAGIATCRIPALQRFEFCRALPPCYGSASYARLAVGNHFWLARNAPGVYRVTNASNGNLFVSPTGSDGDTLLPQFGRMILAKGASADFGTDWGLVACVPRSGVATCNGGADQIRKEVCCETAGDGVAEMAACYEREGSK